MMRLYLLVIGICVHLRSSAVNISDKLRLPRLPIGAPDSIKFLPQSSYEFVLSSLLKISRRFALFAVNIFLCRLPRLPIVAPDSIKYL
jgi:hypothetical protein